MPAPLVLFDSSVELIVGEDASLLADYQLLGCWAGSLNVEEEAPLDGASEKAAAAAIRRAGKQPAAGGPLDDPDRMAQTIKLFAHPADPPEVSNLALVVSGGPKKGVNVSFLSSIDRNLFLIYVGPFFPSWHKTGHYLIYDAAKNSLTVIPEMDLDRDDAIIGGVRAVVLRDGEKGSYVLAELMATRGDTPKFTLWLWRSSTAQWVRMVANVPPKVVPFKFCVDKAFSFEGSRFCLADLFQGILICDVSGKGPDFGFIPLPPGCSYELSPEDLYRPVEYRNMVCFNGSIKFLSVDKGPATVSIWNLSNLDPVVWTEVTKHSFVELWTDASFLSSGLPTWVPVFPTLIPQEDGIVYFVLDAWCQKHGDMDYKIGDMDRVVRINTQSKKLESCSCYCKRGMLVPSPQLLPTS